MKKLLVLIVLIPTLVAAKPAAQTDFQTWLNFTVDVNFNKDWKGYFEFQPKWTGDSQYLNNLQSRYAIGYNITPTWDVYLGYTLQPNEVGITDNYVFEHDIYEQLDWKTTLAEGLKLDIRQRVEEQFIPGNVDESDRWRGRLRVRYVIPNFTDWQVVASEEVFFNLNSVENNKQLQAGFNQNRTLFGVGYQVNSNLLLEVDYMRQYRYGYAGRADRENDILQTTVGLTF